MEKQINIESLYENSNDTIYEVSHNILKYVMRNLINAGVAAFKVHLLRIHYCISLPPLSITDHFSPD